MFIGEIESPRVVHSFRGFEWQRADGLFRVETSGVLARQIFFKHLEILAGKGSLMMIASDERLRLELMNQAVGAGEMPIRVRLVPHSVEPDAADLSVIRQQLTQLPVHEIQVGVPVPGIRAARTMPGAPAGKIIGRMPIQLGVVQEQLNALLMAFRRQHPDHVFAVGRARHDIPVRQFRIEHCKSVVVLGSDGDVLHACGLRQRNPRRRVKLDGIEKRRQLRVIGSVDGPRLHDPFAVTQNAVHAPVNEHSELGILEPGARLYVRRSGHVVLLRRCTRSSCSGNCK